jgi:hypothetical protein
MERFSFSSSVASSYEMPIVTARRTKVFWRDDEIYLEKIIIYTRRFQGRVGVSEGCTQVLERGSGGWAFLINQSINQLCPTLTRDKTRIVLFEGTV